MFTKRTSSNTFLTGGIIALAYRRVNGFPLRKHVLLYISTNGLIQRFLSIKNKTGFGAC